MWPQQEDKKKRDKNKGEVVCPSCGHTQMEPHIAISTFCRGCGDHFSLADARQAAKGKPPAPPKAGSLPPPPQPKPKAQQAPKPKPKPKPKTEKVRTRETTRQVSCFECQSVHEVSKQAESSICPRCSSYISLKDEEVSGPRNSSIQTRGDVVITKRGSITAGKVGCDNLTVQGQLTSSIDCSGTATFKTSGSILGEVRCVRLVVERKSQLRFHRPVHAREVEIQGNVFGDFVCEKSIRIRKKGSLLGDVVCRSLDIQKGSVLVGAVTTHPPADAPAGEETEGTEASSEAPDTPSTEEMATDSNPRYHSA